MSLLVRVELPTYSHSFQVSVPSTGTINDVKREIGNVCVGNPRVQGQRLIWRGRFLGDDEKVLDIWKVRRPCWLGIPHMVFIMADSPQMMCRSYIFQSTLQLGPAHPLALPRRLRSILIHQLRLSPHQLMPAIMRGVTLLLQQHYHRFNIPALPLALHSPEPARPPRLCLHRHLCLASLPYQLVTSTMSLINICARHRS
jgi:hypothetical protein